MNRATKFLVMALFIGIVCSNNVGARKLDKVSKELMDQKPLSLPPIILPLPLVPLPMIPPLPLPVPLPVTVPILGGEAASATKGGGLESGVGRVSKENKVGISISKTAATNGLGDELVVTVTSSAYNLKSANGNAAAGPGGPRSGASGSTSEGTYGSVTADGSNASAYSRSTAYGQVRADTAARPDGATDAGYGFGYAYTVAGGSTGGNP